MTSICKYVIMNCLHFARADIDSECGHSKPLPMGHRVAGLHGPAWHRLLGESVVNLFQTLRISITTAAIVLMASDINILKSKISPHTYIARWAIPMYKVVRRCRMQGNTKVSR